MYVKYIEQENLERQKADSWWPGDGGEDGERLLLGTGFLFGVMKMLSNCGDGCTTL